MNRMLIVAVVLMGCGPAPAVKAGDPCSVNDDGFCDGDTLMNCIDHKWAVKLQCAPGQCIDLTGALAGHATCK